tara:strand:- start:167 stop:742 length:576 start_codon:yes stop_codon:yes gene_type:complete
MEGFLDRLRGYETLKGVHYSDNPNLTRENITMEPRTTRQGKGNTGFYATKGTDKKTMEMAKHSYGKGGDVYNVKLKAKPSEILDINDPFSGTRVTPEKRMEYLNQGKKILRTKGIPTDELVALDKDVIKKVGKPKKILSPKLAGTALGIGMELFNPEQLNVGSEIYPTDLNPRDSVMHPEYGKGFLDRMLN